MSAATTTTGALVACLVAGSLLAGCVDAKWKEDVRRICFAEELSGAKDLPTASEKATKMASFLDKSLETPDWQKFMKNAASMDAKKRREYLKAGQHRAGLDTCPFLDL
jgi:hypothetical protein